MQVLVDADFYLGIVHWRFFFRRGLLEELILLGKVDLGHGGIFLAVDHHSFSKVALNVSLRAWLNARLNLALSLMRGYVLHSINFVDSGPGRHLDLGINLVL